MTPLGKALKKARIDLDLTQQDLQVRSGIDFRHLSAIERGDIDPRWSTLVKLVHALEPYLCLDTIAYDTQPQPISP